jgi:hypothetical protein
VLEHVTLGGGFAGVADEMSRPGRADGDIIIGGANPWDGATSKFGQPAGDSELPNHQDGHGMTDTARDPSADFMDASDHADNVALNRNDAQIKSYDGKAGSLEPGPQDDWPQFAKDGGATVRTPVVGPDGEVRYFYSKGIDVAAGPGPNRRLPTSVMDDATFDAMMNDRAIGFGDQAFQSDTVRPGEIANYGGGASGAWVGEAAGKVRNPDGTRASDIEWMANKPTVDGQITDEQKRQLTEIHQDIINAEATGDPDLIAAAHAELTRFTFEDAARNGNLPRNQKPGGAFSLEMQKGYADTHPGEVDGPISRRAVDGIAKVTYEPEVDGGPNRVKITLKDLGPDGQPIVLWKDSLVLSIGQDARGPGGPVSLLENYRGDLVPIYGEEHDGTRPVVGLQSADGSVRVLGSAATPRDVSEMLNPDEMTPAQHQKNLQDQANQLDDNSRGVVGGFVLAEQHIKASNQELADRLGMTADQQHTETPDRAPSAPKPGELAPEGSGPKAERLANNDAVIEQLAHGMVDRDLTADDQAFLQANGYHAEPPIRGEHQFVMRVFTPTEEGKPPIVAFRGTVPSKPATILADLDPRGIGMWQFNANRPAIEHAVEEASKYGPVVFAGHSLGGALAQTAASRFPGQADRIVTFQAPGVSRGTVKAVEDFNAAHPDNPILSDHHRVTGDLVPKGGRALTPGTVFDHELTGGSRLSRNPLAKHISMPLAQEEVEAGHQVPISRDGQQFHFTGEHSTADDNAHKNQTIENIRTGLGGVVYGPGLATSGAVNGVRRLFGRPGERGALPTSEPTTEREQLPPPAPMPGLPPPAPRPGEPEQEPHRVLAVGESTFEYSQTLRDQLDAEGSDTQIVASGLQSREEALKLREDQNIAGPLTDAPGYQIQHQVDATQLEAKFEPNSLDRIIWNNPEAPDTSAVINDLLASAPKVLRPGGEVNIGITSSPKAKGADVLLQHAAEGTITVGDHRYEVTMVASKDYPYAVSYPSRRTTGGKLRASMGPKRYFIFKLLN